MWIFSDNRETDFGEDDSSGVRFQPDHFPNVLRPGGGYHKDTIINSKKPEVFCNKCDDEMVDGSCLRCDWGEQNRAVPMPNYPLDPFRDDKAGIRAGSLRVGMPVPSKLTEEQIKIVRSTMAGILKQERERNKLKGLVHQEDHPELNISKGDGISLLSNEDILKRINYNLRRNKLNEIETQDIKSVTKRNRVRSSEEVAAMREKSSEKSNKQKRKDADEKARAIVDNEGLRWVIPHNHLLNAFKTYKIQCLKCKNMVTTLRNPDGLFLPVNVSRGNTIVYCNNCNPKNVTDDFRNVLKGLSSEQKKEIENQIAELTNFNLNQVQQGNYDDLIDINVSKIFKNIGIEITSDMSRGTATMLKDYMLSYLTNVGKQHNPKFQREWLYTTQQAGFQTTKPAFIYVYQNGSTIKIGVTNIPTDRGYRYKKDQGIKIPALINYQGPSEQDLIQIPSIEDMQAEGLDPFSIPKNVNRKFERTSSKFTSETNQAEKSWVSQEINQDTKDPQGNPQPGLLALRIERNILSWWQSLDLGPTINDNEHYTETITAEPSQAGGGIASELTFEFHVFLIQKMIQNGGCMEGLIRKLDDADKQELLQHFDYDPNKLYATFSTPVTDKEGNYLVDRQRRVIRKTSDLGKGLGLNFTIHRGRITGIGDIWEEQWQGQKSQQVRKSPELKGFKYDPKVNPDYMQRLLSGGSTPSAQFREGYKDSLNEQQLQFIYDMYEWLNQNSEAIHKDELGNCFIKGQEDRGPVMTAEWHNWAQNELAKRMAVDPNQPADPVEQIEPMQQTSSWDFKTFNKWEGF